MARSGRHFWIRDTTIWNLVTPDGQFHGQAALTGKTMEL
ncbi:MAG: MEKHLA domain-containing protein [Gallionellaceae bacterium]